MTILPRPWPWTRCRMGNTQGNRRPSVRPWRVAMSELEDFLTPTLARQLEAEQAFINGDPTPRLAMWSTQDPVTVFGAMRSDIGSEEVRRVFRCSRRGSPTSPTTASSWWPPAPVGTWPTPSATNTSPSPWTASRSRRGPCASPTSTAARTASGRSSTAMPTPPERSDLSRRGVDEVSVRAIRRSFPSSPMPIMLGRAGAANGRHRPAHHGQ
jgi:hypothetical protein